MSASTHRPRLSLQHFLTLVEHSDDWHDHIGDTLRQMPSVDDALMEMAWATADERARLRDRLQIFQAQVSAYLTHSRERLAEQQQQVTQAQRHVVGQHAYAQMLIHGGRW